MPKVGASAGVFQGGFKFGVGYQSKRGPNHRLILVQEFPLYLQLEKGL